MRRYNLLSLMFLLLLSGCFAHVQTAPKADSNAPLFPPLPDKSPTLVGVALSGGGSRAAYFGAAGLEALAKVSGGAEQHSVLEQVSYTSSVSGGSLASSYFAIHKPAADVHVLSSDGSLTSDYRKFFNEYISTMGKNYQFLLEWRQLYNVRWFNSNQRATSLAETLASSFLDDETFQTLYEREKKRDSPRLILNATLYNNGRRVVMTTVPREDFQYQFIPLLQAKLSERQRDDPAGVKPLPESLRRAEGTLIPISFQDDNINIDFRHIPLSKAVAASASFPFFIGPITVQVEGKEDTYLHIGDGGLFDNQGTESLVQLFLKKLQDKKATRALVIAFDSSFPFWVKNDKLNQMDNGFDIFVKDSGRIVGIMEQRANAYQATVWHILQSLHMVLPSEAVIKVIVLRHTDDVWPTDWKAALPKECRDEEGTFTKREDVMQRLANIPTLFKVACECDKALLREAANYAVEKHNVEIVNFLQTR